MADDSNPFSAYDAPVIGAANNYTAQAADDEGIIGKTADFIAAIPGAAVGDLYNSSGAIVKYLGGDGWNTDTHDIIDSYDSSAASYYSGHKGLVDGAELFATSLIPGTLGIKALRAAQAGAGGSRILTALGLGIINPETLNAARSAAALKATQVTSTWDAMTGELGKALALGVASNTLDAAAFGAAAMVATNASPMYDGMSPTDLIKDAGINALVFGGVLGGAFSAGKTYFGLKGAAAIEDAKTLSGRLIDTGNEFDSPAIRVAQTINSYGDAITANGGSVPADTTHAVTSTVQALAQSIVTDNDNALKVGFGNFAKKFVDTPVEAANMFAKLTDVTRVLRGTDQEDIRLAGQALPVDITNGSIYSRIQDAPYHLADTLPADAEIMRGADETVKINMGAGKPNRIIKATGDITNAEQMAASYWRAADMRTLPSEVEVSAGNIPIAERMMEEVQLAKAAGKPLDTAFLDEEGNEISHEDVPATLRQIKVNAAKELAASFETPENIAARLNVDTKFLDNPNNSPLQARSVSGKIPGMEDMKTFIESPRVVAAKYDIGSTDVVKRSGEIATRKNVFKRNISGGIESVFNAELQGRMFPERLVTTPVKGANTAIYEQQAKAYISNVLEVGRNSRQVASESVLPELNALAPTEDEALKLMPQASRTIGTQTLLKSANNDVGTIGSMLQKIGSITKRSGDAAKLKVTNILGSVAHQISNDLQLGNEWQMLQHKLRTSPGNYVLDPDGSPMLIRQDIAINAKRAAEAQLAGKEPKLVEALEGDAGIPVSKKLLDEVLTPHTQVNNQRLANRVIMDNQFMPGSSANKALQEGLNPVYHIPVDTSRYTHFAFVHDKSRLVGNGGGVAMVMAKDAEQLRAKMAALEAENPGRFEFQTKGKTQAYYKALGEYQYARGMNDSFVDSTLRRKGMLGDLLPTLNERSNYDAAQDFLGFHQRAAVREVRDAVEMRYANMFQQFDFLGKQFEDVELSKFAPDARSSMEAQSARNPYRDAVNMAIDRGSAADFPRWMELNAFVERTGNGAFGAVRNSWEALANSQLTGERLDTEIERLNQLATNVGLEPLYSKVAYANFKDSLPTRPVLRKFISRTQAVLNGLMLGLDPIQAINNIAGQCMFASEFSSLIKMIEQDKAGAGALAGLTKVKVPGTPYSINSAIKLHANATRRYFAGGTIWDEKTGQWVQATRDQLIQEYTDHGLLTSISQQYHQMVDDMTLSAKTLTDAELSAKMDKILDAGRKLTGNRLAEEYTRFVAADAARMLTDVAQSVGKIESKQVASTYWNTLLNRVHGVNIASQRAVVFQGVIGQSIGMFMTYQHNLMQQLFRYAASGDTPAMKALAASQLGIFGVQGLPAFNAVATHIIGNAYGNTTHADPYTYIAKNGGDAAEWILYGAGSNVLGLVHPDLKFNLYSRGDINPRQLTVFPSSIENTVAYSSIVGLMGDMLNTASNIKDGAPVVQSILRGIEHNGINRPLAGLGAVLAGSQTTQGGQMIGNVGGGEVPSTDNGVSNLLDKVSLANFVRIAGAKPLDDAAAADAMYRVAAYQAKTTSDIKSLATSMRITQQNNQVPDAETMAQFMQEYAKLGGNINNFRGFVVQTYKTANSNQVMNLAMKMRNPQSQQVAAILGATNDEAWMNAMGQGTDSQ